MPKIYTTVTAAEGMGQSPSLGHVTEKDLKGDKAWILDSPYVDIYERVDKKKLKKKLLSPKT